MMEFSPAVICGLELLGDLVLLTDEIFQTVVQSAMEGVLLKSPLDDKWYTDGTKPAVCKEAYASLVTLFLESAKHDALDNQIGSILEDLHLPTDRIEFVQNMYKMRKPHLQILLGRINDSLPHIVDVDWKLDYYVKSSQLEHIGEPVYLINIKTEVSGEAELQNVQFSCTLELLQDFVNKLKDAVKSMERIAKR